MPVYWCSSCPLPGKPFLTFTLMSNTPSMILMAAQGSWLVHLLQWGYWKHHGEFYPRCAFVKWLTNKVIKPSLSLRVPWVLMVKHWVSVFKELIFNCEFFTQCFFCHAFPFPSSSLSPTLCSFFSLKSKNIKIFPIQTETRLYKWKISEPKTKQNPKTKKKKTSKQSNRSQKSIKMPLRFLCWPTIPGHGACP